jgi:hypothetical protein
MASIEESVVCINGRINGCGVRFINLFGNDVHFQLNNVWYTVKAVFPARLQPTDKPPEKQDWVRFIVSFEVANRYSHRKDFYIPGMAHLDDHGRVKYYTGLSTWEQQTELESESDSGEISSDSE